MTLVHIYSVVGQPLVRYDAGRPVGEEHWIETNPRAQFRCGRCWRVRWAANLVIQVYYDGSYIWCAEKCAPVTYRERWRIIRRLKRLGRWKGWADD